MELERRSGESELAYHKRLIEGKLVNNVLNDVDYTELSEFVYGKQYSSDVARRMMYGSKKTLDLIQEESQKSVSGQDIIDSISQERAELEKERRRLFDQRREYNKLLIADGRAEHLYASLEDAAKRLNETVGAVCEYVPCDDGYIYGESEAVLVFSDWHYGMVADNEFNKYDTHICKERVQTVVDAATRRIKLHGCRKLHVIVLGDVLQGGIHVSARVSSEELVCDQLMQVSEILAQAIIALSRVVEETEVYITYGNHARVIPNKAESIHRDNIERIIPWWMRQRFSQLSNIHVSEDTGSEFILLNVCGHDICATHGDLDNVKPSPRLLSTLFHKRRGMNIEYIILGDKHHFEGFEELGVTSQICGALCGADDYANGKRLYSTPSQLLLIVNPEDGVDAEYKLKCD